MDLLSVLATAFKHSGSRHCQSKSPPATGSLFVQLLSKPFLTSTLRMILPCSTCHCLLWPNCLHLCLLCPRADQVPQERERAVPARSEIDALRAPAVEAVFAQFRAQLAAGACVGPTWHQGPAVLHGAEDVGPGQCGAVL